MIDPEFYGNPRRVEYDPQGAFEGGIVDADMSSWSIDQVPQPGLSIDDIRSDIEQLFHQADEEIKEPIINAASFDHVEPQRLEQSVPPQVAEKKGKPALTVRPSNEQDISAIVAVDMRSFDSVYSNYGIGEEELRQELTEKFTGRFKKVGGEWMPVLIRDGEIVGVMTCCPTSKIPEDFSSWEDTTDNGTLETTYDANGTNIYVVTLSVLLEGSKGKDMLLAHQIGKCVKEGYELAFFESRLPGLRQWVIDTKLGGSEEAVVDLSSEQKDKYATEYFEAKEIINGKVLPKESLLKLYERVGCKFLKLLPNCYKDEPSMDYGVVCAIYFSDFFNGARLPFRIPENPTTRWVAGSLLQLATKNPKISRRIFS